MKILVAVDGSSYTKRMLAYLAAHDEWLGPQHQYTVIHAVAALPPRATAALDKATVKAYYQDEADKVFKPLRTFFAKQKLRAEFVSKVGTPADVIAAEANKGGYEMLIMGSHGHSSLGNLVMGSVVTKVLAHCSTPLLVLR